MPHEHQLTQASHPPRPATPFSECHVLAARFGSEQNFRIAASNEYAALDSSTLIVDFLKSKVEELARAAGGKALQWVTAELLKAFGMGGSPSDLDEIKSLLVKIIDLQEQVLRKLDDLLTEVRFQHLITRGYESVQRITNIYERLQRLSDVKGQEEREREANAIRLSVLDINSGIFISLKTVSDVLTGKDSLGKNESLIKIFSDRWYDAYKAKQLNEGVPISAYYQNLDQWLRELSIIQYMGVSALANARIANGDYETLEGEMKAIIKQMEEQQRLLDNEIPEWIRRLPEELLGKDEWFVVRGYGLRANYEDDSDVLYGPANSDLNFNVKFRGRNHGNWDEEWKFVKTDPAKTAIENDVFYLVVRSGANIDCAAAVSKKDVTVTCRLQPKDRIKAKLRLVMGRTLNPAVKPDAPRRETLLPMIGFVGRNEYLAIADKRYNFTITGPENQSIRLKIARP